METSIAAFPRFVLRLALCATLASPAAAQVIGPDAGREDSIHDYLQRCEAQGWSGSVLLARDGRVVFARGYGMSDRGAQRKNDADTMFEVEALTMPFTACAIMKLVEDSRIRLEDPIVNYLPGVPRGEGIFVRGKGQITVLDLLTHYSGAPSGAMGGSGDDLEEAVAGYLAEDSHSSAGATYEYWRGGYALLAGIIEVASGTSYAAFCEEHVFGPAGMKDSGFTGDTDLDFARQAVGYDGDWAVRRAAEHPYGSYGYHYRGRGGMVTTANDLWRFTQALKAGKILDAETVELMEMTAKGESGLGPRGSWDQGLGWRIDTTERGTTRVGHGGHVRGFHADYQRFPQERAVVILLSNVDEIPSRNLACNLEPLFLGGKTRYLVPPAVPTLEGLGLDKLVGTYVAEGHGERLIVERAGRYLRISRLDPALTQRPRRVPPFRGVAPEDRWVDAETLEEASLAQELVSAMERRDSEWIQSRLADHAPFLSPGLLLEHVWPKQLRVHGRLQVAEVVSSKAVKGNGQDGVVEVVLELKHRNRTRQVQVVLKDKRLHDLRLEEGGEGATPPELAVEMATASLRAAINGDAESLQSMVLGLGRKEWAASIANELWPNHLQMCGALERLDLIGISSMNHDYYGVRFELRHKRQDRVLKVLLYDSGLVGFDLDVDEPSFTHVYRPVSKTECVMFDWNESYLAEAVSFELDGDRVVGAEWRASPSVTIRYVRKD